MDEGSTPRTDIQQPERGPLCTPGKGLEPGSRQLHEAHPGYFVTLFFMPEWLSGPRWSSRKSESILGLPQIDAQIRLDAQPNLPLQSDERKIGWRLRVT